ncbi:MAG: hypothetical protein DRH11_17820, partial [Deltaproteobacteria bacterium]
NGQEVERGEEALYAACGVDDCRDKQCVEQELKIGLEGKFFRKLEKDDIDKCHKIYNSGQQVVECLDVPEVGSGLSELNEYGGAKEKGEKNDPQEHEGLETTGKL